MSGELSVRHKVIIQALLSRGPLKEKDLHSMFMDLTKKNPETDRQLFDAFILKINKALTCVNFELRGCIDQYDGQVYYGVVNTVSDEQSKLGTNYTVPKIAFYKAIIEAIVQDATANGVVSNMVALHFSLDSQVTIVTNPQSQESQTAVPSVLKNFTMTDKENALHELVKDQWLNLTPDGNIKLGVKSFLDLRNWFRNNDIPSCQVCNEAGVKAELCQNENCTVRIHHYCLKQLFLQRKVAKVCPSCGTLWPYTVEAVPVEDDNEPRGSQRATHSNGKRHRANRIVEDTVEAVQIEDDNVPGGSQRATRSKGKRHRANRGVEDEVVGSSNDGELNECKGSQHGNELARKRSRGRRTNDANTGGSGGASQSSSTVSDLRRVTRSSARLM